MTYQGFKPVRHDAKKVLEKAMQRPRFKEAWGAGAQEKCHASETLALWQEVFVSHFDAVGSRDEGKLAHDFADRRSRRIDG